MTGCPPPVDLTAIEILAWKPKDKKSISEWAEANINITRGNEKGPMRMRRVPYFRPFINWLLEPETEEIVLCKPAQVGGTQIVLAAIGYFTDQEPSPVLVVFADEDTAKKTCTEKIQPIYLNSAKLSPLIGNVFNNKEIVLLNGGAVSMAWASSVAKLASFDYKIVIGDEIDKEGYYTKSREASATSLMRERTVSYYSRKHIFLSTPSLETGNITVELRSCDVIYDWHVPCPYCHIFQPLRFSEKYSDGFEGGVYRGKGGKKYKLGRVVWDGGRKATPDQIQKARYLCGECGNGWTTVEKNLAVESGVEGQRDEILYVPKKKGLHVNRLYSLLGKSGDISNIVDRWVKAVNGRDPKVLQGVVNSTFAEPWKETITRVEPDKLLKARCDLAPQIVPAQAVALTCGVDVQSYGYWFAVRAWARDFENWLIHYGLLNTWDDVENLFFNSQYPIDGKEGEFKRIWRGAVDTGGGKYIDATETAVSMTEATYFWIRKNGLGRGARIWGTKGAARPMETKIKIGKRIDQTPSGKPLPGGIQIVSLDTGQLKDMYHYRLNLAVEGETGPMVAHLHKDTGEDYAKQITAEEKRIEDGLPVWVQIRADNHLLDAEVLAMAAAEPEWPGGGVNLIAPEEPKKEEPQQQKPFIPKREGWLR